VRVGAAAVPAGAADLLGPPGTDGAERAAVTRSPSRASLRGLLEVSRQRGPGQRCRGRQSGCDCDTLDRGHRDSEPGALIARLWLRKRPAGVAGAADAVLDLGVGAVAGVDRRGAGWAPGRGVDGAGVAGPRTETIEPEPEGDAELSSQVLIKQEAIELLACLFAAAR
jgi:hypothetical protein